MEKTRTAGQECHLRWRHLTNQIGRKQHSMFTSPSLRYDLIDVVTVIEQ